MRTRGWMLLTVAVTAALVLVGCGGDGLVQPPDGGANGDGGDGAADFDAASYDGTWAGNWENQTFSSTGSASAEIDVDEAGGTVDITLDLGGNVLGGSDPAPINLSGTFDDTGFSLDQNVAVLGDLSITIDADGNIAGSATNLPSAGIERVDFTGTRSGDTMTVSYTVTFAGDSATATGTLTLDLQP
ncbi:MAG: hypothetical protein U9R79_18700 [Armatimonadota bacterium]|nr:hypothetical protein [Armatimonadota bacterium]